MVHRRGWDVEVVDRSELATSNFLSRDAALAHARALEPEWIELGEVVPAQGSLPQHHRWTTLRRRPDGGYAAAGLNWGGKV